MTRDSEIEAQEWRPTMEAELPTEEQEPPRTPSEKYMASLWLEVIGLERVFLHQKFLDVGGNSLSLNIILTKIETETGAALDAPLFFDDDRSSLFELAKELDDLLMKLRTRTQSTP
jgi:hypothetical protein